MYLSSFCRNLWLKGNKRFRTWTEKSSRVFRISRFLCSMYICNERHMYISHIQAYGYGTYVRYLHCRRVLFLFLFLTYIVSLSDVKSSSINFLVFLTICCSSLVRFKNDPVYLTRETAKVFNPLIPFLQQSLLLRSFLVRLRYIFSPHILMFDGTCLPSTSYFPSLETF